jgi:catechol 2,3-dioxygenase-like lactoylglutathione lyase family enzyme
MTHEIDHIVVAVNDLDQTTADYTRAGFTVLDGGTHAGGLTRNSLVTFQDGSYLELIALVDPAQRPDHRFFTKLENGDGPIAFALRSDGLDEEAGTLQNTELQPNGPRDGGRARPDGQQVIWKTLSVESDAAPALPFLIEDVTDRTLRVPNGISSEHVLEVSGIEGVVIAVGDLDASRAAFTTLLGEPRVVDNRLRYAAGDQWIELVVPDGVSDLADFHANRGDNLYQIVLRPLDGAPHRELSSSATHGLRVRVGA